MTQTKKRLWVFLALSALIGAASLSLVGTSPVNADDVTCDGVLTGTVDNVVVGPGDTCTLSFTTVNGNVEVRAGANLTTIVATIEGNVTAKQANRILLLDRFDPTLGRRVPTTIGGNVDIESSVYGGLFGARGIVVVGNFTMKNNVGTAAFILSTIGGNLDVENNAQGYLIERNEVGGNVDVKEYGGSRLFRVRFNTVDGNLD